MKPAAPVTSIFMSSSLPSEAGVDLAGWQHALADSVFNCLGRDVESHFVVDAAAREDHLGVITDLLGLVREVIRIDADAVAADEPGAKRQEIPLRPGRLEHLERVEPHAV